ncbi:hypothetical protein ND861_14855 [Leptospira sp. 2 VSF19]|uniref:Uncharacterized protein n=1 Tax=Leptospira soteropolitanensis TaxID=2950025 RepID=A0AAW5VPG2_9LEPT|nr:hypothetical protein [Leptospira soteropolitanensis]MCW7493873.1 hypothetical protein [Leptospira soteropolitanensis]MCW7501467.1 hypothetical protein [Leptospira soteropolitanensis]MCW7523770.1 hypothetical protein [Leptospira soteropolitanensis]MCW7527634.1 hypothetical protein [Leptospira soteropolitanensis]MCW7531488.1 hypothetical protein [Leptospira soteropolitanensis]
MIKILSWEIRSILTCVAIFLTFYAYVPYIRGIRKGSVRPHVFSWIIWGVTTFIVFFAQVAGNGGIGSIPIGVSGIITFLVAFFSYHKRGDIDITKSDWFFFGLALSSLPFWFYFSSPLAAVLVLSLADILGFIPTFRKGYVHPNSEPLGFYLIFLFRNLLAMIALAEWNITTLLFPGSAGIACVVFVVMVKVRKTKTESILDSQSDKIPPI